MAQKGQCLFNPAKRCFQSASSHKSFRGVTTSAKIKTSVYAKNSHSMLHGSQLDAELTRYINTQCPVTSQRALDVIAAITRDLNATPVAAQVPVANHKLCIATAIDILAHANNNIKNPILIELKYSAMLKHRFLATYDSRDPKYPTFFSRVSRSQIPNTPRHRHIEQLTSTLQLYARSKHLHANHTLRGALVVACEDGVLVFPHSIDYQPNTGINAPASQTAVSSPTPPIPKTPQKKKHSIKRLSNKINAHINKHSHPKHRPRHCHKN
jgi:hypothetical protein